jgi:uncharacterized membrane protein YebE (DUF533 family)
MEEKKALNKLMQEIAESVSKDVDTAKSYLDSQGIDTNELITEGDAIIRRMALLKRAAQKKMKRPVTNETWTAAQCARAYKDYADYLESQLESITHDYWCQCDICLEPNSRKDILTQTKEDASNKNK